MKRILYLTFVIGFLLVSCSKIDVPSDTPICIKKEIKEQKEKCLIRVTKYKYNGEYVYLFKYSSTGSFENLLNSDCELLCSPSGGIAGIGDGKCPDFYQNAIKIEVIWSKE